MKKIFKPYGKHLLFDIKTEADVSFLRKKKNMERFLLSICSCIGATPLSFSFEKFEPQGETALLLLSESHISIHTYPESNTIFMDIFTCGNIKSIKAVNIIKKVFGEDMKITEIERGKN